MTKMRGKLSTKSPFGSMLTASNRTYTIHYSTAASRRSMKTISPRPPRKPLPLQQLRPPQLNDRPKSWLKKDPARNTRRTRMAKVVTQSPLPITLLLRLQTVHHQKSQSQRLKVSRTGQSLDKGSNSRRAVGARKIRKTRYDGIFKAIAESGLI